MRIYKLLLLSILLIGCKSTNIDKVGKVRDNLAGTRVELAKNGDEKLRVVSTLAAGADYSLKGVTNPPIQVKTAMDYNARIMSIAGNPDVDEINKIKQITDLLNSEVARERERGVKLLKSKDTEIMELQVRQREIQDKYEAQVKGLESQAMQMAKKADKLQVVVDEVNSWFGLGGVVYGFKRFVSNAMVGIFIFLVCFIVLRFLSTVNPIAAAIFSIFEHIASYVIAIIKGIVPKSIEFSNHIEASIYNR